MADALDIVIAGEPLRLLADRALYWPARRRLLISDLHLGKGDAFRSAGIALPSGGTLHDLARIEALVAATGAQGLWVLGDFLHGDARERSWRECWESWRARNAALDIGVLAGNHDRALGGLGLDIALLGHALDDGVFSLRHAPDARARGHVLCGHLHPTARIDGLPRRWPAFWLRETDTVLPAFSRFTGGRTPSHHEGGTLVACIEGHLLPLAPTGHAARRA